jgi:hypothetical protein
VVRFLYYRNALTYVGFHNRIRLTGTMRALLRALLILTVIVVPRTARAQERAEFAIDARLTIPELLLVDVVDHIVTSASRGRVELSVSANTSWTLTVSAKSPDVECQLVGQNSGRIAQGKAGNGHRVIVEYEYRSPRPNDSPPVPVEYVLAAR